MSFLVTFFAILGAKLVEGSCFSREADASFRLAVTAETFLDPSGALYRGALFIGSSFGLPDVVKERVLLCWAGGFPVEDALFPGRLFAYYFDWFAVKTLGVEFFVGRR